MRGGRHQTRPSGGAQGAPSLLGQAQVRGQEATGTLLGLTWLSTLGRSLASLAAAPPRSHGSVRPGLCPQALGHGPQPSCSRELDGPERSAQSSHVSAFSTGTAAV